MTTKLIQGPIANLPTKYGLFNITIFKENDFLDHAVIFIGDLSNGEPVLCRIHSECLTGDVFGSLKCDCGFQLAAALEAIQKENWGLSTDLRLTEITEVYEYGAMRVQPTFGTPLPATIDWSEADG